MHARGSVKYQHVARDAFAARALDERDPSLLTLPVPLSSIPVLSPILTPLVAGAQPAASSSSKAVIASATSAPGSTPTPSSQSGSSSSSSSSLGSGGSSSGSGSSSSGSSGSSSGSSNGGNTSGSSNTNSNGNGSSNGSSGGITTSSSNNNGGASGASSALSGGSSSEAVSGSGASVSGPGSSGLAANGTIATSSTSQATDSTSNSSSVEVGPPVINVAGVTPASGIVVSGTMTISSHGISATGSKSSDGSSSNGGSSDNPDGSTFTGGDGGGHHLSAGAIAAIVVVSSLVLIALVIFALRRRSRARRSRRLNNWRAVSSSAYNFDGNSSAFGSRADTVSARSSFATSYDISSPGGTVDFVHTPEVPAVPAMVEIRDTHGPGFITHAQRVDTTLPPIIVSVNKATRRASIRSTASDASSTTSSDPYSQCLVIRQPAETVSNLLVSPDAKTPITPTTPMSVRPFSPTEKFSFPKPPKASGDWGQVYSEKQSELIVTLRDSGSGANKPVVANPFLDPEPEFDETGLIRRPFSPALDDELLVSVGERVKILQIYSDGWALVEKVGAFDSSGKGKAKEVISSPGLIPINCMREAGQKSPAFLPAKRVSSYGVTGVAI